MKIKRKQSLGCRSLGRGVIYSILKIESRINKAFFTSPRKITKQSILSDSKPIGRLGLFSDWLQYRHSKRHSGIFSHQLSRIKKRYLE